jgi:hypothetical protein
MNKSKLENKIDLLNYIHKDILQYVFNLYIDHFVDVYTIEKYTDKFKFDLNPFMKIEVVSPMCNSKTEFIYLDSKCYKYIVYYENGNKCEESTFLEGVINGKKTYWHKNGNIDYTVELKNCLKDGIMVKYDKETDNIDSVEFYKNNVRVGNNFIFSKRSKNE